MPVVKLRENDINIKYSCKKSVIRSRYFWIILWYFSSSAAWFCSNYYLCIYFILFMLVNVICVRWILVCVVVLYFACQCQFNVQNFSWNCTNSRNTATSMKTCAPAACLFSFSKSKTENKKSVCHFTIYSLAAFPELCTDLLSSFWMRI